MNKKQNHDIESLIEDYGNDVLRIAYMYVKDTHTAEDMFQEVFIKVNKNLGKFKGNSSIKTWIIRITINTCKDYLKSAWNKRVVPIKDYQQDNIVSDSDFKEIESKDTADMIKETVLGLPDKYRDVILCVYYGDMSIVEAAEVLDIAEGTVKSRLYRARNKLKPILEGRVSDEF
mgnify:CR=1 FL=1